MSRKSTLGPLERDVMDALWAAGPSTVRDTRQRLTRKSAYTTIMTVMNRLVQAGWLRRQLSGHGAYEYVPVASRTDLLGQATRQTVDELVKQYGDIALVQFMERLDKIPAEKQQELRKMLGCS